MVNSPLEQPHNLRLRQRIEMQVEAHDRRGSVGLYIELVGFHREHGEQIAVRMVALRWTTARRSQARRNRCTAWTMPDSVKPSIESAPPS